MLGSLVMPHNIYLHSALVQSRKVDASGARAASANITDAGTLAAKREAILYHAIEGGASLVVAVFINLCVMFVFAKGFHGTAAADSVGLSSAGECALRVGTLRCRPRTCLQSVACQLAGAQLCGALHAALATFPKLVAQMQFIWATLIQTTKWQTACPTCRFLAAEYGSAMKYIWALGLLAAGQSSTMTGTYTGQFIMSGFFDWHLAPWQRALVTRSVALVPTLTIAVLFGATHRLDALNADLNVLQSFALPFALLPVLYVTSRSDVMGSFRSRRALLVAAHALGAVMLTVTLATAALAVRGALQRSVAGGVAAAAALAVYCAFVAYLITGPARMHALLTRLDARAAWTLAGWLAQTGVVEPAATSASESKTKRRCIVRCIVLS